MGNYIGSSEIAEPFVPGDLYVVTWDGTDYECAAREIDGGVLVGNEKLLGYLSAHDEPFVLYTEEDGDGYLLNLMTESDAARHTVAIRHVAVSVKPLDMALMPRVYLNGEEAMSFLDALNYLCRELASYADLSEIPFFTGEPYPEDPEDSGK